MLVLTNFAHSLLQFAFLVAAGLSPLASGFAVRRLLCFEIQEIVGARLVAFILVLVAEHVPIDSIFVYPSRLLH